MYDNRKFYGLCLVGVLMIIGIGYAYFTGDLEINGDALYKRSSWNIYFATPTIANGSVSGTSVTTPATVTGAANNTVEYAITLTNPKDYYEFTVPIKNDGTIDAMISSVSNKVYASNTEISLPDYLDYSIKYTSGASVQEKQILRANSTETVQVRVYFRDDIDPSLLPTVDTNLSFKFNVVYVQADNTAIEIVAPAFDEATSWDDVIEGIQNGDITPTEGSTKKVTLSIDLDNDNVPEEHEYTLRVVNTTTPAECSTEGFSQTACGIVIEFEDIITNRRMNPSYNGNPGTGNLGGWAASEMRTYVNTVIYNSLPAAIRNAIIDTYVVSGHGNASGEVNNTSTDKLYLLSTKEVGYDISHDTAKAETRTLDYYVDNNDNEDRIRKYNNSDDYWWLRTAYSSSSYNFSMVNTDGTDGSFFGSDETGVVPAFRIA